MELVLWRLYTEHDKLDHYVEKIKVPECGSAGETTLHAPDST